MENKKVEKTIDKLYEIAKNNIELRKKFQNLPNEEKEAYIKQFQNQNKKPKIKAN